MRRVLFPTCTLAFAALSLASAGCTPRSALAEPVSIEVVRSTAAHQGQPPASSGNGSLVHLPLDMDFNHEVKTALIWDSINWKKQDVLVVHFEQPGRRIGGLRIKGSTLFVQTVVAENGADTGPCQVAVIEKSRATQVVVEEK